METMRKVLGNVILTLIIVINFNKANCQVMSNESMDGLKDFGYLVDYFFLPQKKSIQFMLVANENDFVNIIKSFKGTIIQNYFLLKTILETDSSRKNSDTDDITKAKVYFLENGFFAIDNREVSKANPFYITKSIKDFLIINENLLIYYYDKKDLIIECSVHGQASIKEFLKKQNDLIIKEDISDDNRRIFMNSRGMAIYLSYAKRKNYSAFPLLDTVLSPYLDKDIDDDDDEIYFNLIIYESYEKMELVGSYKYENE